MKHNFLLTPIRSIMLLTAMFVLNNMFAATFTAVASGNWSSAVTWGGSAPSFSVNDDQITIPSGITVTLDNDLTVNGLLAELTVNGTLNSSNTTSFNIIAGTVNGAGTIDVGNTTFGAGSVLLFTGIFTTENLTNSMLNLQVAASMTVNNTMTLSAGVFNLRPGGSLMLANGGTIVLSGGSFVNNGGTLNLTSDYNVTYSGNAHIDAGLELSGTGLQNVTIDVGDGNSVSLSADLTVNGTLTLASGYLDLNGHHLVIAGNVASTGNGSIMTTATSNLTISSSSGIAGTIRFAGTGSAVNNFTLSTGGTNQATIAGDLKVNGVLTLTSGVLVIQSGTLDIAGNIAGSGTATISSSGGANIIISSPNAPTGSLQFTSGSNALNNLTININNGGTVNIGSNLVVNGNLNFTKGRLNIGSNSLTLGSSATITNYGSSAYIITGTGGSLGINLTAGSASATVFPVGTADLYFPATVKLNTGSNSGMVMVGVTPNVYAHGTSGTDLTLMQHAVDATWDIRSNISSNMNMDIQLMWDAAAEVNGFNRQSCYISHYIDGKWDASAKVAASSQGGSMYSLTRTNISSLSPFAVFDNATVTGIERISGKTSAFEIYPNPAVETLYLYPSNGRYSASGKTVEIMNISGLVLATVVIDENGSVNVASLPAGMYYIKVDNNINKFTKM